MAHWCHQSQLTTKHKTEQKGTNENTTQFHGQSVGDLLASGLFDASVPDFGANLANRAGGTRSFTLTK
jgi:hypothetical protein